VDRDFLFCELRNHDRREKWRGVAWRGVGSSSREKMVKNRLNTSSRKHQERGRLSRQASSYSTLSLILVGLILIVCVLQVFLVHNETTSHIASLTTGLSGGHLAAVSTTNASNTTTTGATRPQRRRRRRRWAYVFLLADCDPTAPQPAYRGILYNILAATFVLKYDTTTSSNHSQAEIVVLVQMSAATTTTAATTATTTQQGEHPFVRLALSRLPPSEEALLHKMNITIRYLPRPKIVPTFYELVMAKFHVLSMVEYTKILFLDGDVLPLCNLDYLLELSETTKDSPRLGETVLHAMYEDPVNAGLFVVTPRHNNNDWIFQKWNEFRALAPDQRPHVEYRLWKDGGDSKSGWDFYCADSDQGFLLYWSLFLQDEHQSQSLSIIVGPTIEQYDATSSSSSSSLVLPQEERTAVPRQPTRIESSQFLSDYSCLAPPPRSHTWAQNANTEAAQWPFYQDFYHMVGYSKAWETSPTSTSWKQKTNQQQQLESTRDFWYFVLQQVVDRFDPDHTVIPDPIERLSEFVGKPKIRGDLLFTIPKPP
jgi:hypothetical protein